MVILAIAGLLALAGIGAAYYVRKRRKKETEADEMPAGLQIFDADGNCVFDTTDYTFRTLGTGTTGTEDGGLSDSRITEKTVVIPYAVADPEHVDATLAYIYYRTPIFTASDGSISWQFFTDGSDALFYKGQNVSMNFVYGEWQ